MQAKSKVFRGIGAFVVDVRTLTDLTIGLLADPNGVDDITKITRIVVDMTKTPSKDWATAVVDDRGIKADGSQIASLTPWLEKYLMVSSIGSPVGIKQFTSLGMIYLEDGVFSNLKLSWPKGSAFKLEELTSVVYETGERYHGRLGTVKVINPTNKNQVTLDIGGVLIDIDYKDPSECDASPPIAPPNGCKAISDPTLALGDQVLVFVALLHAAKNNPPLKGPKMPIGLGA